MLSRELNRPPRIAPVTESAGKSSIRRGTPTWPIRTSVWTEPGRWTSRTQRSPTAERCHDRRTAPERRPDGGQSPKSRSTIPATSSPARSPATMNVARAGIQAALVRRPRGCPGRAAEPSPACRRPAGGRGSRRCRSSRRTPPPPGGEDRRAPGAGRSGAHRGVAPPRRPGTSGGGPSRRGARARARGGAAGTSTPAEVASQLASAWRLAPRRSAASTSSMAS